MSAAVSRSFSCVKNFRERLRWMCAACVALPICVAPLFAQQAAVSSAGIAQAAAAPVIRSYPNSPEGLQNLINDMLKLQKDSDAKDLAPYLQSLVLPNADAWFRATFGDQIGAQLGDSYNRMNLPLSFPDTLGQLQAHRTTKLAAILFTDSCNPEATDAEYPVLMSRTHQQPLYVIHASSNSQLAILQYFAYVEGGFRYLSNFQMKMPDSHALKIGANVMAKKLTRTVFPVYPDEAKYNHIEGKVVLHATVGMDGRVCQLQVVSGPPLLNRAALEAVSQWQYSPTTLNGQPVEVDTLITVVFDLGPGP